MLKHASSFTTLFQLWVSQVEVNLFPGETTILQSDIIYDSGQSLNPAVDLGQVNPTTLLKYFISFSFHLLLIFDQQELEFDFGKSMIFILNPHPISFEFLGELVV